MFKKFLQSLFLFCWSNATPRVLEPNLCKTLTKTQFTILTVEYSQVKGRVHQTFRFQLLVYPNVHIKDLERMFWSFMSKDTTEPRCIFYFFFLLNNSYIRPKKESTQILIWNLNENSYCWALPLKGLSIKCPYFFLDI